MEVAESVAEVLHGHEHVLEHLVLLVHALDRLTLRQLEQRDLRRHHPAEHPAEDEAVAERNDVLWKQVR